MFGVLGVIERGGNTLYSTVLFIDPAHGIVGKHRKLMPTGAEHLIWGCGDGSTLTTAKSAAGRGGRSDLLAKLHADVAYGDV